MAFWLIVGVAAGGAWFVGWRWGLIVVGAAAMMAGALLNEPLAALMVMVPCVVLTALSWPPLVEWAARDLMDRMPRLVVSDTERIALEAGGTVGFEQSLMRGAPDWAGWMGTEKPTLTADEQAFLDGPVEQLCQAVDEWEISQSGQIPHTIWSLMRAHNMGGLVVPKDHGGLGFSAYAHHRIITRIASVSGTVASVVGVPNSLGPAELIVHYGTADQKSYWLPRLARLEEIPCFALTSTHAGSDAGSLTDLGTVSFREGGAQKASASDELGLWLDVDKRYITLAPLATVVGVACRVVDPNNLLQKGTDPGITLVLVRAGSAGLSIGATHKPMDTALPNGPVRGRVFVALNDIIGGVDGVGRGWSMIMECLAIGRAITLPSVSTGVAAMATATTGAYAQIRQQFGHPLMDFEAIQDQWWGMLVHAWGTQAMAAAVAYSVDRGERPAVGSAVAKYQTTERTRRVLQSAMDIHGGRAIQAGPNNYLAFAYQSAPIGITVEGANTLTRSLMVYAPALLLTHPTLADIMRSLDGPVNDERQNMFRDAIGRHVRYASVGVGRAWMRGVFGAQRISTPDDACGVIDRYAAALAVCHECALVGYGPSIKRRETQAGRMADALGSLWMAAAVVRQHHWAGRPHREDVIVAGVCAQLIQEAHDAISAFVEDLPPLARAWARLWTRVRPGGGPGWSAGHIHTTLRPLVEAARKAIAEHSAWPQGRAASVMNEAGGDASFVERLRVHQPTEDDKARWDELLRVDEFAPKTAQTD